MKRYSRSIILSLLVGVLFFACTQKETSTAKFVHPPNAVADSMVILPPAWAFGVLYGGYTNQEETIETIRNIQKHDYPIDAYWIDSWFWSYDEKGKGPDKYIDFVADTASFPDRKQMWDIMEKDNIKGGFWTWDCILETGNEEAFNEFDSLGFFSKKYMETNTWHNKSSSTAMFQKGSNKAGTLCGNIDFDNPDAVAHFKNRMKHFFDEGADFIKLDRTTKIETVRTIFEISQEFGKETKGRGFMLSHAGGLENNTYKQYPVKWTSDTRSDWTVEAPLKTFNSWVPNVSFKENIELFTDPNKEVSKIPFLTNDTGGFDMGNTDEVDEELYIRWVQFSTFNPIMEVFSQPENITGNLAFNYSEKADDVFRKFTHLRLELFPYIYSYALQCRLDGQNIIRPIEGYLHQFYFGEAFMVAPVCKQGTTFIDMYFPEGTWIDYWTNEELSGGKSEVVDAPLEQMPLYVKKGSIIPMRAYASSIEKGNNDTIFLHVYPGKNGQFTLLEDDGISNDYLKGKYAETRIEMENIDENSLKIRINKPLGHFEGMLKEREVQFIVHSPIIFKKAKVGTQELDLKSENTYLTKTSFLTISNDETYEIWFSAN
jgi:alpha-glucosidase (family GH31 glycosyl hydrolase)